MSFPHKDDLVISIIMSNYNVYKLPVDDESVNILLEDAMTQMSVDTTKLTHMRTPFIIIKRKWVAINSVLNFLVIIKTYPRCCMLQQTFMVIKMNLFFFYNAIIGRLLLYKINAVINNRYLTMKFLIDKGVTTIKGSQIISRICISTCLKGKNTLYVQYL